MADRTAQELVIAHKYNEPNAISGGPCGVVSSLIDDFLNVQLTILRNSRVKGRSNAVQVSAIRLLLRTIIESVPADCSNARASAMSFDEMIGELRNICVGVHL